MGFATGTHVRPNDSIEHQRVGDDPPVDPFAHDLRFLPQHNQRVPAGLRMTFTQQQAGVSPQAAVEPLRPA